MKNYLGRHLKDKSSGRFGNDLDPSRGYMAWLNWGGDPGSDWVNNMRKNSFRGVERQQLLLPNPYDLENPYHKPGRDQFGKVCFYIYNDDGSQVVGPMGPRFCYDAGKADLMVQKAEREGKRVSPSAVSPGPRAAPTGFVRERIQEQREKPVQHNFLVGEYLVKEIGTMGGSPFYLINAVSPSSVVVKHVGSAVTGTVMHPVLGRKELLVPDSTARGYDGQHGVSPFRLMIENGKIKSGWSYVLWDGQPVMVNG